MLIRPFNTKICSGLEQANESARIMIGKELEDFTFGPTMSLGPSGCSISTLRLSVPMVVAGVTRALFTEDRELHWQALVHHPSYIP